MSRTLSPLLLAACLAACARSEAPLDAELTVYDAPVERVDEPTLLESQDATVRDLVPVQTEDEGGRYRPEVSVEPTPEPEPEPEEAFSDDADGMMDASYGQAQMAGETTSTRGDGGRSRPRPAPRAEPASPPATTDRVSASGGHPSPTRPPADMPVAGTTSRPAPAPPRELRREQVQQELDFNALAPGSEQYTEYGVNGFTNPGVDALSTFAVDVDTASYAVTRRKLREGYLPPTAAVRVEEFVNYFPYDYVEPGAGFPFAVDFEAAPSPYNPRNHLVRVGIQGKNIDVNERKPVHLTFLVDVSGSMRSSDKLGLLKESLSLLTRELDDGDTVAIATYAGRTDIVLPPTPIRESNVILGALDGLSAGGSTAMSSGIDIAYELANQTFVPGDVNRVIVCSDGDANVGSTSHSVISEQIRDYAERGITLTTLGFGNGNYQDTMMERLANDGDGNYFYIDALPEARRVLVDQMTGTLEVIAKDVKIQVEWDADQVLAYRLIGYENRDVADRDFRNDAVDAGEIGAGHQVTALYEVALVDDLDGEIATVRIRNKAPGPDSPAVERSYSLGSKAIGERFVSASSQFRIATAAAGFAEVLRGSPHMSEVSLRDVLSIAQDAQRVEYREDAELVELIDQAAKLRGEGAFVSR